jgi:hypothetical protein
MLLASLTFYECVLVKIYPWLLQYCSLGHKVFEVKTAEIGKHLRGSKDLSTAEMSVCKNFINLVDDLIKWMGTYVQEHPYTQLHFRSAFRILLEKMPELQENKVTHLNFFKPEDPNRYQAYYLEKESGEAEG